MALHTLRIIIGLLLAFIGTLASSCVTLETCQNRFGPCGQIITERETIYKDSTIILPSAVIHDTLPAEIRHYSIVKTDSAGLVRLKIYYDEVLKRVVAECERVPDTVKVTNEIIRETKGKIVKDVVEKVITPSWAWWVLGIIIAIFLIAVIISIIKIIK